MKALISILSIALTISLVLPLPIQAEETDHPLVSRYPGSILSRKEVKEYEEYKVVVGLGENQEPAGEMLQGRLSRMHYNHPRDRSTLEIFQNYVDALTGAGLEIMFQCANEECGPAYAAGAWNRINGITTKSGADCRYLAGRMSTPGGDVYVAVMVGKRRHQIDIMEVKGMETDLVRVDAAAMGNSLDSKGSVSLYGIYFETDKSALKPESQPTLLEIAKLMKDRPDLKIYVVGHTDNVGTLRYNMGLAAERARAVVKALVDDHGIAVSRLDAHGVGPLSPRATNRSDPGRGKNRRVELVEQ